MSAYVSSYSKAGMAKLWLLTHINFTQGQFIHSFQARIMLFLQDMENH